jgi:hypothetical protein
MRMQDLVYGSHTDVDSRWQLPHSYTAILLHQRVHSCNLFLSDDRHLSRSWAIRCGTRHTTWTPYFALDMRPHTRPSFDAKCHLVTRLPCTGIEWRRIVLAWTHPFDALAAITFTTMQHTRRRLTLFCSGTANSLLCTPTTMWPPRQLLALLPCVSYVSLEQPLYYAVLTINGKIFTWGSVKSRLYCNCSKSIFLCGDWISTFTF